jgi:hypothetical protein
MGSSMDVVDYMLPLCSCAVLVLVVEQRLC